MIQKLYTRLFLYAILILCLGIPGKLVSQPLDSLLGMARAQNLTLLALQGEYRAALEKVAQSRLLPSTEVGLGGFVLPVQTRVGPQRMRLGFMQKVPWFGTLDAQEQLSKASAEPLSKQVEIAAIQISYQIKLAYFLLYELQEKKKILSRTIEFWESLRRLSLKKLEGGKASTADVLRLEIKLRELNKKIEIIDQKVLQPQADINQLLNRELGHSIQVSEALTFAELSTRTANDTQNISKQHPSLGYLSMQQSLAKRMIELNEKQGKPSLGFGADYLFVEGIPSANIIGNGRDILQVKASLNIPLQRKPYQAKKQEELLKIEALEHRKHALEDEFSARIQKSTAAHEEARLYYELYTEQVSSTRAVIDILQSDYSNHGNRFDELINLELDLLDYEIKQLEAIVTSHKVKAAIEQIIF